MSNRTTDQDQAEGESSSSTGLRAALARGDRILGTFVMIPRVEIVEMLARTGFDAVVFDLEHAAITVHDLPPLAAAARGSGLFAVARIGSNGSELITQALDAGVDGILAPHIASADQARDLVRAGRFPPTGERSLNPYVRGTGYGWGDGSTSGDADGRTALIAMLEGDDALSELDAICAVEGLDAVFIGPVDLSASLGLPEQPEHPSVVEAVQDVLGRAAGHGAATGIYAPTPEAAARWFAANASLVALSADIAMALRSFAESSEATSSLLREMDAGTTRSRPAREASGLR